ncbi:MAG: alpha-hydroxy acid oxidase [Pseudomonadota bacterium]
MSTEAAFSALRLQPLPEGLVSLRAHEAQARSRLDAATWAYFNGGSADEITRQANDAAWNRIGLLPRVLRPLERGHTRVELLGRTLAHPILLAPVAFQTLAHPDGELASAQAAAAQGAGFVLSTQSSLPLETIAQAVRDEPARGPLWFQLYLQPDRGLTRALVERAERAGYEALVLTVDAPVQAPRDAQALAGFRVPPGLSAHLPPATTAPLPDGADAVFDRLMPAAPTWADLEWLRSLTRLPLVLKGITHPADARQALTSGVAALIVSNHGGRSLDTVPSTAQLLPAIAQTVDGRIPLLVDGGIRRGTDVLKALALGARAVLVGRPVAWGLANAGALGVAHVIRLLRDELTVAMALCGCARPADAEPALLSRL